MATTTYGNHLDSKIKRVENAVVQKVDNPTTKPTIMFQTSTRPAMQGITSYSD